MGSKKSTIEIILSAKDTGLSAAMSQAKAQVSAFSSAIATAARPIGSMISSAFSLKTAIAGIVTGAGITALASSLIDAGQKMDSLKLSFLAIGGSGEKAASEMEFVRKTSYDLGLDLETTATAYKSLSAAAMGTSLTTKQIHDVFLSVSKASTTLGLSADETSGALLAISQMISKGKVSAEELRGQLGERLPGAFQLAAQAMGMTTAAFDQAMAQGQIMATDFIPKFAAALDGRFSESAKNAANTFSGSMNRIHSDLFLLKAAFGEAITNNTFFVTAMNNAETSLRNLSKEVEGNGAKWRAWVKDTALGILDFAKDTVLASDTVYRAISAVNSSIFGLISGITYLRLQYLEGAKDGAKWAEKLNLTALSIGGPGSYDELSQKVEKTTSTFDEMWKISKSAFQNMEDGSPKIRAAAQAIQEYRDKMAQVDSSEVIGSATKKATEDIVKMGDKWVNVAREMSSDKLKPQIEIEYDATQKSLETLRKKIEEQGKAAVDINVQAAKETASSWQETADDFEKVWLGKIGSVSNRLDDLKAQAESTRSSGASGGWMLGGLIGAYRNGGFITRLQALATGGGVRNILSGGRLSGYGGGDRRLLLGEDGEFMIRKEAVRRYGAGLFHSLNGMRFQLPEFAMGGSLGPSASLVAGSQYAATYTFTDHSGQVGRLHGSEIDVRRFEAAMAKADKYRSGNR